MTMFACGLRALPVASAILLAACGGGQSGATANQLAGSGMVAVPSSSAPVMAAFIERARQADCADTSNRLFLVDEHYVFWERSGKCGDNSYAYGLYGATPEALLCSNSDSIAGPMTSCVDDKSRALFDSLIKNLDQKGLHLDDHKIEPVSFLPRNGSSVAFATVASDAFSGVASARMEVIKDETALRTLWAEHNAGRLDPSTMPKVDFSTRMVVAAFAGQQIGCHEFAVRSIVVEADSLQVKYELRDIHAVSTCIAALTSPMRLVTLARSDAPVSFVQVRPEHLAYADVESASRSLIAEPRNLVLRDAQSWSALWAEHAGKSAAPVIDFSREMVIAVFAGVRPNVCHGSGIGAVYREGGKIHVVRVDSEPLPDSQIMCTQAIITPAHMVKLARSDDAVEFSSQIRFVP